MQLEGEIEMKNNGFVYIIKEKDTNNYKIGKTNNLKSRFDVFEVKLPFEFEVIHVIHCDNYHRAETAFHNLFKNRHANGEWYELSQIEVDWLKIGRYPYEIQRYVKRDLFKDNLINDYEDRIKCLEEKNATLEKEKEEVIELNKKITEELDKENKKSLILEEKLNSVLAQNDNINRDELFIQALKLFSENKEASTSSLQVKFNIGYVRARRIVDQLEREGLIGPNIGSRSREVLVGASIGNKSCETIVEIKKIDTIFETKKPIIFSVNTTDKNYRPTIRMSTTYRDYVDYLFENTCLDKVQILKLGLFIGMASKEFMNIVNEYKSQKFTLSTAPWGSNEKRLWM